MICNECETVAHCMKNGCIPKQQSQRTWVGLTEQQALDCFSPNPVIHSKNIEAKLKELNT